MIKNQSIIFLPCKWEEINSMVTEYYGKNQIIVDSFWEDHVMTSCHYKMIQDGEIIGFFAIHNTSTLMLFHVLDEFAYISDELFMRVKKYEQVTNAMIPTGDELFLSHAVDHYARLEKQAYFFVYAHEKLTSNRLKPITMRLADIDKDSVLFGLSRDFLVDVVKEIREGAEHVKIYVAQLDEKVVGFGVVEYGRVIRNLASIGMYVCDEYRQQGFASNILYHLKLLVESDGFIARSGCWYYNHNSKKSMESIGAFSKTRLLRFYF